MFRFRSYISILFVFFVAYSNLYAASFTITVENTNVTCKGDNDGTGTVSSINGGIAPFTYSWKDINSIEIGTDSTITGLAPGDYFITVRDFEGDEEIEIITVKDWFIFIIGVSESDITCSGDNDGSISYNALGLHGGLVFSIDSGYNYQTSSSFSDLVPDDYYIYVQDEKGCIKVHDSNPISITEPSPITITVEAGTSVTILTCYGDTDGSIDITPDDGTPGYTYAWTGPGVSATTQDIGSLGVGEYFVTVTDTNLCEEYDSVTITSPPEIIIQLDSANDISCFGLNDGSIGVTVSGGDPKALSPYYDFEWTRDLVGGVFSTNEDIFPLVEDTYYLKVTDEIGCEENSGAIAISEPDAITVSNDDTVHVSCFGGSDGEISITIGGGTGPYTAEWSGPGGFTSASQDVITGLKAGDYSLLVTDASGCTYNHPAITITQPDAIIISIEGTSNLDLSCFGDTDGSIDITVSGGTPAYSYSWTGPSFSSTEDSISSLGDGEYTLIVTDNISCKAYDTVTITEPEQITIQLESSNDISCFGEGDGSIDVSVSGGTEKAGPPYDYSWTSDLGPTYNTEDISDLEKDNYYLMVTDENSCTANSGAIFIDEPDTLLVVTNDTTDVLCYGDSTGAIDVSISGGIQPYILEWSGPGVYSSSDEDITNIPEGDYSLLVTDANGCTYSHGPVPVTEPAELILKTDSFNNISCNGSTDGSIYTTTTGGTTAYVYSWTSTGGYTSSDSSITGLPADDYTMVVTDGNLCQVTTGVISITEPLPLSVSVDSASSKLALDCYEDTDGSINITVTGGTPGYRYSWSGPSFTSTDEDISALDPGDYILNLSDTNSCTLAPVTITITRPAQLVLSLTSADDISCYGAGDGRIITSVTGGTQPYSYDWTGPGTYTANDADSIVNLQSGDYDLVLTDANGCKDSIPTTGISEPDSISASVAAGSKLLLGCSGDTDGRINISVTGGIGTLSYSWSGPDNYTSNSKNIGGLRAGDYDLIITDSDGCMRSYSPFATITELPQLFLTLEKNSVSCFGDEDGSIIAHATGGTPDYVFSRTTVTWQSDSVFPDLAPGGYIIFVRDQNNCQAYDTVVLDQPPDLYIASEIKIDSANICYGDSNGEIIINAGGGTPPLMFSIDSGATYISSHIFLNLPAGEYNTLVTDTNGCTQPGNTNVLFQPPQMFIDTTITGDITSCSYANEGSLYIQATGGVDPKSYTLDSAVTSIFGIFDSIAAGPHLIQIEDNKGCVKDTTIIITAPPPLVYDSTDIIDVTGCYGDASGEIFVLGNGGTGSLQYSLDGGALKDPGKWSSLTAADYTVTVQDDNSCTLDTLMTISQPDTLGYSDLTVIPIVCHGENSGMINITGSGGNPPYNYTLMPGSVINTTGLYNSLSPGSYTVEINGAGGCPAYTTDIITFTDPPVLSFDSTNYTIINCQGANDGSIELFAKGGVSPINYSVDTGNNYTLLDIFSGLSPATYITVIQDANGCIIRGDTIVLTDPPGIQVELLSSTDITCYGDSSGSITLTTSGGTAPLEYSYDSITWQSSGSFTAVPAGSYRVYMRDANGCADSTNSLTITQGPEIFADITSVKSLNGQPGSIHISSSGGVGSHEYSLDSIGTTIRNFQSDTFFTQVWPEIYDVVIRDNNSCTLTESYLLEATPPLLIGVSHTDNTCFGDSAGSITLSSVNGTGLVQYSIDGGTTQDNDSIYTGLASADYFIYAIDEDHRIFRDTLKITQPEETIVVIDTVIQIRCTGDKNGAIHTSVSKGIRPVNYSWTSQGGFTSSDSVLTDLIADIYELEVTDSSGCKSTPKSIEIKEPVSLSVTPDSTEDISCYGNQDGAIYITVNGGSAPYSVLWTGPDSYESSSWDIVNLDSGNYQLVVTDQSGCTANHGPVNISEPDTLAVTIDGSSILSIDCAGSSEGRLDISVSGGVPSYSYLWSGPNGFTSLQEDIASLEGGEYRLIVIDGNSCNAASGPVTISEPEAIVVSQTIIPATCFSSSFDGSISLSVSGGTGPFTYLWSNNATSKDISGLDAGNYSVSITDANDCEVINGYIVSSSSSVRANAGNDTAVCPGEQLILDGQGGDFFLWQPETGLSNPNIPNPVVTVTDSIQYILIVSDPLCVDADTLIIKQHPQLNIDAGEDTTITIGQTIQMQTSGGPFESYSWLPVSGLDDPESGAPMLNVIGTFTYIVTATDSNGCSVTDSVYIEVPHGLVIYSGFTPNNDGVNDYWDIDNTGSYPGILVTVINRWGKQIFLSEGYFDEDRWDGKYNGKDVPTGTYYYIIRLDTESDIPPITGTVTIVR